MMRSISFLVAVLVGACVVPSIAAAQTWDTPSFLSPLPNDDIGVYAARPDGGDWGFHAIWRQSGNVNLGARVGIVGPDGSRLVTVGGELSQQLPLFAPETGFLVSWTAGIGASFNGVTQLRVPVGVTAGLMLGQVGGVLVTPYVHPRVAFDLFAIDTPQGEETQTEFNFPVDIGADLNIGDGFVVRIGATLDDRTIFGAGVAIRTPRRVAIR
jgi:hypothetical protein